MEARTRTLIQHDLSVQVVLLGGGIAGLWLLDELTARGHSALLLEARGLGSGQTIASQGIIHGGLKYTLQGMLTRSAAEIREMPRIWKECLSGTRTPDLSPTPLRSEFCYLWRTESLRSRLGMIGARAGLRVAPTSLDETERPRILQHCPGTVARLDEQVLSPAGLMDSFLQQHRDRLLKIDAENGLEFNLTASGDVARIRLTDETTDSQLNLVPEQVVFTAGKGNICLRQQCGLPVEVGQTRPLHMVVVRGELPWLNGHCVDGAKTRVTISSERTSDGQTLWQLGGQIAELGVEMTREEVLAFAASELQASIPGIDLKETEWSSYRVDRAEPVTGDGKRPEHAFFLRDHNIWTAWPTKLALAPQLADHLLNAMSPLLHRGTSTTSTIVPADWPRPPIADYPWEREADWTNYSRLTTIDTRRVA